MHALYLVDDIEKDPVSREQLVKVEKAFEVAEAARKQAVTLQEKYRGERVELAKKFDAEKKKARSLQSENVKLADEVAQLKEEVTRLKVVEETVGELTEKVESLPIQVAEAVKAAAEQAVDDFKKSAEFAAVLRDQHRKSVAENVKLYRDRGWLNLEKFKADREADLVAARAEKEEAAARAEKEATEATVGAEEEREQTEGDQGEQSGDERDRTSTSVPKTPGVSGSEIA